ncbi:MAG: hypothetical protein H8E26_08015 [FCB group bacterium]|nr:hypothetical protein [FCB group bacterium]MBL7027835.1 hypothetical protein [Candidatus Neomarinimicrobiota bacterium]MBL7120916.1 hypothetical protein [Candidatus Neomarinimicrobiota bacterium]
MSRIKIIPLQFAGVEVLEQMLPLISARFKIETLMTTCRLDLTPFFDPVRSQYNANDIIQKLVPLADEGDKIVGVTDLDLFIPVLSYIFGQAYLGGSVALVSGHRLVNARYGLADDPKLFSERLLKCIIHELGHAFGLKHCLLPGCVMDSTTYVEEMDQKSDQFCRNCKIQLK